jgi:hypothetical protein
MALFRRMWDVFSASPAPDCDYVINGIITRIIESPKGPGGYYRRALMLSIRKFVAMGRRRTQDHKSADFSLSSFYKFPRGAARPSCAFPLRCPIRPHAQFISRESSDPVDETALSESRARQLVAIVPGDSLLELRDLRHPEILPLYRRAHRNRLRAQRSRLSPGLRRGDAAVSPERQPLQDQRHPLSAAESM